MYVSTEHNNKQRFVNRNLQSKLLTDAAVAVRCHYVPGVSPFLKIGHEIYIYYTVDSFVNSVSVKLIIFAASVNFEA
jgi:hypothetical protein